MSVITGNPRRRGTLSKSASYLEQRRREQQGSGSQSKKHHQQRTVPVTVKRSDTPVAAVADVLAPPPPSSSKKQGGRKKKEKKQLTPAEKRKRYLKWAFWILVLVSLYFTFGWLREQAILLLQMNPYVWDIYLAVEAEISSRSLLGLFYAATFGALFFIALPVELIFLYYLGLNYYFVQVLVITLLGNLLGISFDYFIGWLIGPKVLQWFMKQETYKKYQQKIDKAGAFIIIVGNIIPFPIEPFTVFLGAMRYGYVRLLLYTLIGKTIKFGLLWLGYKYFVQYVGPHISTVNLPWFMDLIKSSFGG